MTTRERLVKEYVKMLRIGRASVFIGAGLSRAKGFVDWKELLREPAEELGLDVDKEHDLVGIAEMVVQRRRHRGGLTQDILDHLGKDVTGTENHRILANLPIQKIWTTNYDTVIEETYKKEGIKCQVVKSDDDLTRSNINALATVYKMHGDINQPNDIVLTRDDYEGYEKKHQMMAMAFNTALVESTFLFLGFSFTDPNLQKVFGRIRANFGKKSREHFAIMREPQPGDNNYEYEKVKFNLLVEDLRTYGIQTVIINDYAMITEILRDIETTYFRRNVFVSGSYFDAGSFGERLLQELSFELGKRIISEGYNLTSGFGLGIGANVLSGALGELYESGKRTEFYHRLSLYPFPLSKPELFTKYREDMIRRSGFSVFIAGNKEGHEIAPGVIEEYKIAKEQGKAIIPIGATGGAARKIWDDEKEAGHFAGYDSEVESAFHALNNGNKSNQELINAVFYIIRS